MDCEFFVAFAREEILDVLIDIVKVVRASIVIRFLPLDWTLERRTHLPITFGIMPVDLLFAGLELLWVHLVVLHFEY